MDHLERMSKRLSDFAEQPLGRKRKMLAEFSEQRLTCDICKAHYARGDFGVHYESERHQRFLFIGTDDLQYSRPTKGKMIVQKKSAAAMLLETRANQIVITKVMRESSRHFNLYAITPLKPLEPSPMRKVILELIADMSTHTEAINRLARAIGVTQADSMLRYEQIHFPCNPTSK